MTTSDGGSATSSPTGPRCSQVSAQVQEPMVGTAPRAVGWVAVEQNGPWGASALQESHLDPAVGAALEARCAEHHLRPCLIRRPGRHADAGEHGSRTLLVAHSRPEGSWLLRGTLAAADEVLALDFAAVAAGDLGAAAASLPGLVASDQSHLLVCTNGTRDLCCALEGRRVARGVAEQRPDQVWETTHTSGHRFAPTAVVLPSGYLHGRLDTATAAGVLSAADHGRTELSTARGRSCWSTDEQAAEHAVRGACGELGTDALSVERDGPVTEGRSDVVVNHRDGRRWRTRVEIAPSRVERPASCGKDAAAMSEITVRMVRPEPPVG